MAMALTLERFLADRAVPYEVVSHRPTTTSLRTAEASHISGDSVAKAVVLKDKTGYLLAVLPASHRLDLRKLEDQLHRHFTMVEEQELGVLFRDCEHGAVPPIGVAYGLDVVVDDSIAEQRDVYFEAGDHASLVHVTGAQFGHLMAEARHGRFSQHN